MLVAICSDVHLHVTRLRLVAARAREAGAQELWCLQRGLLPPQTAEAVRAWSAVGERSGVGPVL